jgi:hypothetical protein
MRPHLLAAGVAVAALIPSLALAQQTCEQRRSHQTAGTIAGAGIGALLGGAVAGHDDRAAGVVVGGLGGALLGHQLSRSGADCAHAYGYYDNSGAWHASSVQREDARGYYDRQGAWVEGAPNGHYDRDGRWIRASNDDSASGYTDRDGRWVPVSASGYYTADGRWVSGAASGHYDRYGRWIAGPATGRYDDRGRWIPGRPYRVGETQPGYWDQGRWQRGPAMGYYDARGRWIDAQRVGQGQSVNAPPTDISRRQMWLDARIHGGLEDGSLTRYEGDRALRTLASIGRDERNLRTPGGNLRPRDRMMIEARLDRLTESVGIAGRGPVREY